MTVAGVSGGSQPRSAARWWWWLYGGFILLSAAARGEAPGVLPAAAAAPALLLAVGRAWPGEAKGDRLTAAIPARAGYLDMRTLLLLTSA